MISGFLESPGFDVQADEELDGDKEHPFLSKIFLQVLRRPRISVYQDSKIDTTVLEQRFCLETLISPERSRGALSAFLCL